MDRLWVHVSMAVFDGAFSRTTLNFVSHRTFPYTLYPSFNVVYLELVKFDQLLRTHWRFFGNVEARPHRPHMSPVISHPAPSEIPLHVGDDKNRIIPSSSVFIFSWIQEPATPRTGQIASLPGSNQRR
jgi:hypothetical protein